MAQPVHVAVDRAELDRRIGTVTSPAPHQPWHIAAFVDAVLANPVSGVLVECGAYQGVGTAKLSHLADMLDRDLIVFDSFRGLPANDEPHIANIDGENMRGMFTEGAYAGSLIEVRQMVADCGAPEVVHYVEGWFVDTLPRFREQVAAVYLDVDLATSARTCLENLWPLVTPGGVIVSQDGDFPLTIEAMRGWAEHAAPPPTTTGLGVSKMVVFRKVG
jgi:O-methyltransferase